MQSRKLSVVCAPDAVVFLGLHADELEGVAVHHGHKHDVLEVLHIGEAMAIGGEDQVVRSTTEGTSYLHALHPLRAL